MNAAAAFRRAAILQVLLALAAFAVADRNAWFLISGGVLAVASSYITEGPRGRHLPNWAIAVGVSVVVIWGVVAFAEQPDPRGAAGVVGVVVLSILMLKLYGRKTPNDWRQILALTVVIVVAAALNSVDLLAGLLVLGYAAATLAAAMLYQLYAGERVAQDERRTLAQQAPMAATAPIASGPRSGILLRRMLVASCVLGLVMSVVVFVLFPRESLTGAPWRGGGRQSGFSVQVRLDGGDRLSLSSKEVFSVRMLDPQGQPSQFAGPLHLRGAVLDVYSPGDRTWTSGRRSEQAGAKYYVGREEGYVPFALEALSERANVWTQVVEMRSLATEYVFAQWLPIAASTSQDRMFVLNQQTGVLKDGTYDRNWRPWSYALRIQPYPGPGLVRSVLPSPGSGADITFPVPEVVDEANRLLVQAQVPGLPTAADAAADPAQRWERNRRIARWFTDYLGREEFHYTTDLSGFVARREDPNVAFLRRYKYGHCEFFASALAGLCRSVGVEARVVTGFLVSEYDSVSEAYIVRESNAHAWVEVRTGEWQWTTYDPSPQEALLEAQTANRTWLDQFRWMLDPLEFAWQSRVVSFDSGSQAELAQRLSDSFQGTAQRALDNLRSAAEQVNRAFRLGPAGYIWLGLVGVLAVIAVMAAVVVLRRDRMVRTHLGVERANAALRARLGRDAAFYLDALTVLERAGCGKPRWRTPMAHAQFLQAKRSAAVGAAFQAVVERFYQVRYAGQRPGRRRRTTDAALVAALRSSLARGYTSAAE